MKVIISRIDEIATEQKQDVPKDKNSENLLKLQKVEIVLEHCIVVNNDY